MENDRQPFAGYRVQDLFHKDETLAGSKICDAAAGNGKTFTCAGGAVFGFGFDESEFFSPKIALTVGDLRLVPTTHCCRRSNRIRTGALARIGLNPNHHASAIGCRRNPGEGEPALRLGAFPFNCRNTPVHGCTHTCLLNVIGREISWQSLPHLLAKCDVPRLDWPTNL